MCIYIYIYTHTIYIYIYLFIYLFMYTPSFVSPARAERDGGQLGDARLPLVVLNQI